MSEKSKRASVRTSVWVFYAGCAGIFGSALFAKNGLGWSVAGSSVALFVAVSLWAAWFWDGKGSDADGSAGKEDGTELFSDDGHKPDMNINGMPMRDGLDCLGNTYGSSFNPDE